ARGTRHADEALDADALVPQQLVELAQLRGLRLVARIAEALADFRLGERIAIHHLSAGEELADQPAAGMRNHMHTRTRRQRSEQVQRVADRTLGEAAVLER